MKVSDILEARDEVLKNEIDGVLKSYKVDSAEKRIESNPEQFFEITYPSNTIKNIIEAINLKLKKITSKGNYILAGPYGSGKSHVLILIYHLFNNPELAQIWLNKWNLELDLPTKSQGIIISLGKKDYKYLWEPIFEKLDKIDLLKKVDKYPGTDLIEEAIGDDIVLVLLDEIETWYQSFNRDNRDEKAQVERNRFFLQNLFEVATDKNRKLLVFLTYLDKGTDLDEIINREQPFKEDIGQSTDRHRITFHRLFKTPRKEVDWSKVEKIINEYINLYDTDIIENVDINTYKRNMSRDYPFHPQCVDILKEIYKFQKDERQNLRGYLGVLADVVAEKHQKTDLFLLSDLDIKPFRLISRQLVGKTQEDITENCEGIKSGVEILKTVLFYTLDERKKQASRDNILLATLAPDKSNRDDIIFDLEELAEKTLYMHPINRNYFKIKDEKKWSSIIDSKINNIENENAKNKIAEILKERIKCDYIFDIDDIPDDNSLKIICVASDIDKELTQIEKLLSGKQYQNRNIFLIPKSDQSFPFKVDSLLNKAKRVIVEEQLVKEVDTDSKKEISRILKDDVTKLNEALISTYGEIIRWIKTSSAKLSYRNKSVKPIVSKIKSEVLENIKSLENNVFEEISGKTNGVKISSIISDFFSIRGNPVIESKSDIHSAIKNLYRDQRIVILKERGKYLFPGRDKLGTIKDTYLLVDPEKSPPPPSPEKVEGEIMKLLEKKENGRTYKTLIDTMISAQYNFHIEEHDIEDAVFSLYNNSKIIVKKDTEIYRKKDRRYSRINEDDFIIHHLYDPGDPKKKIKLKIIDLLNENNCELGKLNTQINKHFEASIEIIIEVLQDLYNKKEIEIIDETKIRFKKPKNFPDLTSKTIILKSTGFNTREFILTELKKNQRIIFSSLKIDISNKDSSYSEKEIIEDLRFLFNTEEIEININNKIFKAVKDNFPEITEDAIILKPILIKTEIISCSGNTRSVSAELEARVMQTDKIKTIIIKLEPEERKSKEDLLDLFEKLFDGKIEVEVEIEKFED